MAARRFLYVIAGLVMLTLAAAIGWNLFQDQLMRAAFVPSAPFKPLPDAGAPDYATPAAWLSRPDLADDPSRWTPAGVTAATKPQVAVFYLSPTTYLSRAQWNAPLNDAGANDRLRLFASTQASAFNGVGAVWAPRYRQASIGAFLTTDGNAQRALEFAYADVLRAWDAFVAAVPEDRLILLAGHSQGSLHLVHLLRDRIAGSAVAKRIVAVYAPGWPISIEADLPALGLPGCAGPGQPGCIVAWQSFAEPADTRQIRAIYDATTGMTGRPRRGTAMLCVNPLTGAPATAALPGANLGALVPRANLDGADLVTGRVPARCDPSGFLMIGGEPQGFGRYVLPGRNYHVFDYMLFWANIRADAAARTAAFLARG
ncbi:DUF3089 domain-containing protein [Sphingomonas jatrophae]|uniref:DUF3089 domain-containing protein n=1 Tax=Sphingomonas jatrophae TaxID=1166337 RepID=A0A1I6JSW4_9SPHN|nr:DUF3089 domain-containing protein [Sphingomonas jatrophae]SFR81630.1 Protein of unknown function [Sphingomonas jatrophae]